MKERNIALIGFRATGKSAVGKIVARILGRVFIDMDQHLMASAGREIACWVRLEGWESFRSAESELLEALASRPGLVVATGGGVVLGAQNRRILARDFVTIWLKAPAQVIEERIASDSKSRATRPPLSNMSPDEEIRTLLHEREPLYAQSASIEIDTDGKSINEIADQIAKCLESAGHLK
ncbi:MAG: shikimate kinase [Syntrophobacter sp.]